MALKSEFVRLILLVGVTTHFAFAETSAISAKKLVPASTESGTLYSEVSLSSWQNALDLNSAGNSTTQLYADPIGICPGLGYRLPFADSISWDANACVFLGRADVSVSSNAVTSSTYSAKNVFVLGMQSQLGLLFTPTGQTFQFGLGIPFLLSHANWPSAGAGQIISSNTQVHSGVLIESRFYAKNKVCIDPKIEWLQTDRSMLWSLNFTYDL